MATRKPKTTNLVQISTADLDAHIKKIIAARIAEILKDQLDNIIMGELAKLKLTGKSPTSIVTLIDKHIKAAMPSQSSIIKKIDYELDERIGNAVRNQFNNIKMELDKKLRAHMASWKPT